MRMRTESIEVSGNRALSSCGNAHTKPDGLFLTRTKTLVPPKASSRASWIRLLALTPLLALLLLTGACRTNVAMNGAEGEPASGRASTPSSADDMGTANELKKTDGQGSAEGQGATELQGKEELPRIEFPTPGGTSYRFDRMIRLPTAYISNPSGLAFGGRLDDGGIVLWTVCDGSALTYDHFSPRETVVRIELDSNHALEEVHPIKLDRRLSICDLEAIDVDPRDGSLWVADERVNGMRLCGGTGPNGVARSEVFKISSDGQLLGGPWPTDILNTDNNGIEGMAVREETNGLHLYLFEERKADNTPKILDYLYKNEKIELARRLQLDRPADSVQSGADFRKKDGRLLLTDRTAIELLEVNVDCTASTFVPPRVEAAASAVRFSRLGTGDPATKRLETASTISLAVQVDGTKVEPDSTEVSDPAPDDGTGLFRADSKEASPPAPGSESDGIALKNTLLNCLEAASMKALTIDALELVTPGSKRGRIGLVEGVATDDRGALYLVLDNNGNEYLDGDSSPRLLRLVPEERRQ